MEARLGHACREAREEAELSLMDIANRAGVSQSGIHRFEHGTGWRRDTEEIVAAYATECGLDPDDLWRAALNVPRDR